MHMTNSVLRVTVLLLLSCMAVAVQSEAQSRRRGRPATQGAARPTLRPLTSEQRLSLARTDTVTLPWFDDVEKGAGEWSASGMWHIAFQPQRVSVLNPTIFPYLVLLPDSGFLPSAYYGNGAWWFGEEATGTFIGSDFDRNQEPLSGGLSTGIESGDLISPPINLVGQKNALLTFETWWEVEGVEADAFDLMSVWVSADGGSSWYPAGRGYLNPLNNTSGASYKSFSSDGLGRRARWTLQEFDLTNYVGQVIMLRFNFDTGDEEYNGFRGWLIDDISVTGSAMPAPGIETVTPGVAAPGEILTINGSDFENGARIDVDSSQAFIAAVMSSTTATFVAPYQPGSYSVQITNPNGLGASRLRAFIVSGNQAPSIYAIQPDSAQAGVSVPFTLFGANLQTGATVDFGGVTATGTVVDTLAMTITGNSPPLTVGYYNIGVTNPDGLHAELILGFNVYMPQITVGLAGDTLKFFPPSGLQFNTGKLYYRMGGTQAFDSLNLASLSGAFTGNIPAAVRTIRGLQYYVVLRNSLGGSLSYPPVNPSSNPAELPLRFSSIVSPLRLSPFRYMMISVPGNLDSAFIGTQLEDDLGPYDPLHWRLFRWKADSYVELPLFSAASTKPGDGYWIVTAATSAFDFKNITSTPSVTYPVAIDTGWTQIGDPFGYPVAWSSIAGASDLGVIGPYGYDGTEYSIDSVLVPFSGYFVYNPNATPEILIFQPIDAAVYLVGKTGATAGSMAPGEFVLHLAAQVPGSDARDTHSALGLKNGSAPAIDAFDAPKPPPIGTGIRLDIMEGGRAYLHDYKPWDGEGQSWTFSVTGSGITGKARVMLSADGVLPSGSELHVLDLDNENAVSASTYSFDVDLPVSDQPHHYKVIIGTTSFLEKERQGIPLVPLAFGLEQNFPNPFNPETRIRYTLGAKSDVSLEIFDALGQKVRTLVEGTEGTGIHEVTWNGMNGSGGIAATGVYFCRLRAGSYSAVRKLLLIR
jgi:hypothetical protein